jgi:GNAT superfamily N-acetyltransferase
MTIGNLIAVRRATKPDLQACLALYAQLRPNDPAIEANKIEQLWHEVVDGPHSMLVVAEHSGHIAATCMLSSIANLASGGRRIGIIEHVITDKRDRQLGMARRVLEFALTEAWRQNCCKVMLLSGAERTAAHALYKSVGFRADTERGFVAKPSQ